MEETVQTASEIECPYCAEKIQAKAKKCKHCGEILDSHMRELDLIKSKLNSPQVITNVATSTNAGGSHVIIRRKFKGTAALWALLLGGIGAHKFYLGQSGMGFLYLIFVWTGIPMVFGVLEALSYASMSQAEFDAKYNSYITAS